MASRQLFDDAPNLNRKAFIVPAGHLYQIDYGQVTFVSSATAGNRQVGIKIEDAQANLVFSSLAGAIQAASLTRTYTFVPAVQRESAFVGDQLLVPIPPGMTILQGWTLTLYDSANIGAGSDDMVVSMLIDDRSTNYLDANAG